MESIKNSIESRLSWFRHLVSMGNNKRILKMCETKSMYKTQRNRYHFYHIFPIPSEDVEDMKKRDIKWMETMKLALNKREWVKFVYK